MSSMRKLIFYQKY